MMCRVLGYSRDSYYKRQKRGHGRHVSEAVILKLVKHERRDQPRVGTRKLHDLISEPLGASGIRIGRDKLFQLLRRNELLVRRKRRFSKTTYSSHRYAVSPNRIKELVVKRPNEVWVSDITYLRVGGSFAYLFLVTDLFSRMILGYHLSRDLSHYSALIALDEARKRAGTAEGIIHHSDRGCQYCCHEYLQYLQDNGAVPSMTDESHCYQNAVAERVNGILKDEFDLDSTFDRFQTARDAVERAVSVYNYKRTHWSLDLQTPHEVYLQAA